MSSRVSLAELIDSDVPLRPDGAVAVLREVCRQYVAGDLHGIPNATVIRLTPDGGVVVEGPVNRDHDPVTAAATLLTDLLPGFETPTGFKVPGGLRLVIARAMRAIDLPPFSGIAEFSEALSRFSAPDLGDTVGGLFRAWAARHAVSPGLPPGREVTISDIRRARRATGLSLEDVARACGVPAWRLRELEWGYMRNWTADDRGRQDLCAYARAAGLDKTLVVDVAWPLMESTEAVPAAAVESVSVPESVPAESWTLVPTLPLDIAAPLPWRSSAADLYEARDPRALPLGAGACGGGDHCYQRHRHRMGTPVEPGGGGRGREGAKRAAGHGAGRRSHQRAIDARRTTDAGRTTYEEHTAGVLRESGGSAARPPRQGETAPRAAAQVVPEARAVSHRDQVKIGYTPRYLCRSQGGCSWPALA